MSLSEKSTSYNSVPLEEASEPLVHSDTTLQDDLERELEAYRQTKISRKTFYTIVSTLTGVIFVLAGLLIASIAFATPAKPAEHVSAGFIPRGKSSKLELESKPILRTFEDTLAFGGRRSNWTDSHWDKLIPPGDGFIPVFNPAQYGLPVDERFEGANTQLWGVSVFHQLHCVSMLRRIYWNDRNRKAMDPDFVEHAAHCFDFLRQAISCYSDTTLEMPQLSGQDDAIAIATYSSPRMCRNFEEIHKYTGDAYMAWKDNSR